MIDRLNHRDATPIDREDILALVSAIDDVVDFTEEVADYLGLYKIEAPMEQSIALATVLRDATALVADRGLPAAGIRGPLAVHHRGQPPGERGRPLDA